MHYALCTVHGSEFFTWAVTHQPGKSSTLTRNSITEIGNSIISHQGGGGGVGRVHGAPQVEVVIPGEFTHPLIPNFHLEPEHVCHVSCVMCHSHLSYCPGISSTGLPHPGLGTLATRLIRELRSITGVTISSVFRFRNRNTLMQFYIPLS